MSNGPPSDAVAERMLEQVRASPECVGRHDKAAWLALFADNAVVEDPVGSAANPKDRLPAFWDAFIACNAIRFEVEQDLVGPGQVVRDVLIHTEMASGLTVQVPALLLYELSGDASAPKIVRLAAHWELPRLSWKTATAGWLGFKTMMSTTWRLLRTLGMGGTFGYLKGMVSGVFGRGRRAAKAFADAASRSDEAALTALFGPNPPTLEYPAGRPLSVAELLATFGAGATLSVDKVLAAGWVTACRFRLQGQQTARRGVVFFEFDRKKRLRKARFFV